jgi:cytochrome c oxidase subunit 3
MVEQKELFEELEVGRKGAAKPMLWVSMISMVMFFAGLTSAYVISMKRDDWVTFDLPDAFFISTAMIVLSSITFMLSEYFLNKNNRKASLLLIVVTLILGVSFIWQQYVGFQELKSIGLFFTGPESTVSTSFVLGITFMHVLHILAGIIVLIVVIYNHFKYKYKPNNLLGFELGAIFWHFVDILWIYLFLFFYFIS